VAIQLAIRVESVGETGYDGGYTDTLLADIPQERQVQTALADGADWGRDYCVKSQLVDNRNGKSALIGALFFAMYSVNDFCVF
jgi:hypothetical protein